MTKRKPVKEFDPTIERLLKEAADETGVLTSQLKDAYYITMQLFMSQMRKKEKPILIPNMGLFFISPYKTQRLIDRMFQSMRKREAGTDPEGMTRENVAERLKNKYWDYHNLARTHYERTGRGYKVRRYYEELEKQKELEQNKAQDNE